MTKADRKLHWTRVLNLVLEDEFLRRCSKIAQRDPEMRILLDKYITALLRKQELENTSPPLAKTR